MLAEEMAKKSRDEIFDISMKFQQENGELPAMLSAVLFDD